MENSQIDELTVSICHDELVDRFTAKQRVVNLNVEACPKLAEIAQMVFGSPVASVRDLNDLIQYSVRFNQAAQPTVRDRALVRGGLAFLFCNLVPDDHDLFLIQRGNPGTKISAKDTKKVRDTWAFMNYKRALSADPDGSYTAKSGQNLRPEFRDAVAGALGFALKQWPEFSAQAQSWRADQQNSRILIVPEDSESRLEAKNKIDRTFFITETFPDGTTVPFGASFVKSWTLRNNGNVPWIGRSLKRITPQSQIYPFTAELTPIATTLPGETVTISVDVVATRVPGFSEVRFKMIHENGEICWPHLYPYGVVLAIETREMTWGDRQTGLMG